VYSSTVGLIEAQDVFAQAYAGGVTMGNDLAPDGERAPAFIAWATRAGVAPRQDLAKTLQQPC